MIGALIEPELHEMIRQGHWAELREAMSELDASDVAELLCDLPEEDMATVFRVIPQKLAAEAFTYLPADQEEMLLHGFSNEQVRQVIGQMPPDDQARMLEELPAGVVRRLMETVPAEQLKSARDLLGYPLHSAGRYMTPRYVAVPPDMTAAQVLDHIRKVAKSVETVGVVYVVDKQGKLLDDMRLASLVLADPAKKAAEIDDRALVSVPATMDREELVQVFRKYDRGALPVTDSSGYMLGIITVDDVLDVAQQETTEDIQKIGGMEALDVPYMETGLGRLLKKRGGWLSALFMGEMLTATAMGYFDDEIKKAVVLALFIPLIISSGGNSGSQAATLIIRALALGEVTLADWWRVMRREIASGLALGAWLGFIGFLRVVVWQSLHLYDYGSHYVLVALTVWMSLIGVVMFGTLAGSMLPFIMRRLGFDPAASSAPFVATLVDVTGLIIYFTVAWLILAGTLL